MKPVPPRATSSHVSAQHCHPKRAPRHAAWGRKPTARGAQALGSAAQGQACSGSSEATLPPALLPAVALTCLQQPPAWKRRRRRPAVGLETARLLRPGLPVPQGPPDGRQALLHPVPLPCGRPNSGERPGSDSCSPAPRRRTRVTEQ